MPRVGPHDFLSFVAAKNVIISNGILGLSAHHGVHGNESKNITLLDLVIKDFEVAGISINEGKNITVKDVEIGPTSEKVGIEGGFSSGR